MALYLVPPNLQQPKSKERINKNSSRRIEDLKIAPDESTQNLTFRPIYRDIPKIEYEIRSDGVMEGTGLPSTYCRESFRFLNENDL